MSRDYVFTSWSEPMPVYEKLRYVCWGVEQCPTTGRIHYQGFAIFNRTHRYKGAKQIINGGDDIHLETRRGTRQEAKDYCAKDGKFTEFGEFEALTNTELFRKDINFLKENYPAFFCRYHKGLYLLQDKGKKWRDVKTIIYYGGAGTGKTRKCMEMDDIYKIDYPYVWWDGYMGEKKLLIDDFSLKNIQRGHLLNLLDGYRLRLETKGSHTWANWEEVYITMNGDPKLWTDAALLRRIAEMTSCDK